MGSVQPSFIAEYSCPIQAALIVMAFIRMSPSYRKGVPHYSGAISLESVADAMLETHRMGLKEPAKRLIVGS